MRDQAGCHLFLGAVVIEVAEAKQMFELQEAVVPHRKFEVMVLVKDLEPFIVGYIRFSYSDGWSPLKSCCVSCGNATL